MSLSSKIMPALKEAMKAKDQNTLTSLRAIKAAILIAQTESGAKEELTEDQEIKLLQKLVKQRKDSAAIFNEQGRADLADPEIAQADVIAQFLPIQLSEEEVSKIIEDIIASTGASGMKDMGKVMGMASAQLAGQADGKTISTMVKQLLT